MSALLAPTAGRRGRCCPGGYQGTGYSPLRPSVHKRGDIQIFFPILLITVLLFPPLLRVWLGGIKYVQTARLRLQTFSIFLKDCVPAEP